MRNYAFRILNSSLISPSLRKPPLSTKMRIMENTKRTVTCGALTAADAGKNVILNGWVMRTRELGGLTFIMLRDRYGITHSELRIPLQEECHK